jgi:hypothetical protein
MMRWQRRIEMRKLTYLLFLLLPTVVHAACGNIAEIRTEVVDVSIGDYCDPVMMITFATKKAKAKDFGPYKKVPFSSECTLLKNGFKCHPKGKTPLAGATYKKIYFGRSQHDHSCGSGSEPSYDEPGEKYICVKGCSNSDVPEFLYGDDGSC